MGGAAPTVCGLWLAGAALVASPKGGAGAGVWCWGPVLACGGRVPYGTCNCGCHHTRCPCLHATVRETRLHSLVLAATKNRSRCA